MVFIFTLTLVVIFRHLVFQVIIIFFASLVLLLPNIICGGVHSHFGFILQEAFFFELFQSFFDLWLKNVLMVLISHSVLCLFRLLNIPFLIMIAPSNMPWRKS